MIPADRLNSALYALHLVLVEMRSMAFGGTESAAMAEILDWAEAMPFLIAEPDEDRTESFRSHLRAVAEACPRFRRASSRSKRTTTSTGPPPTGSTFWGQAGRREAAGHPRGDRFTSPASGLTRSCHSGAISGRGMNAKTPRRQERQGIQREIKDGGTSLRA